MPKIHHSPGWIDTQRLLQADAEPGNWMSLGRNFSDLLQTEDVEAIHDFLIAEQQKLWKEKARK